MLDSRLALAENARQTVAMRPLASAEFRFGRGLRTEIDRARLEVDTEE